MRSTTVLLSGIVVVVATACASGRSPAERGAECALQPADSVFLHAGPVFRACSVQRPARMIGEPPKVDFQGLASRCLRATVEFVVGSSGIPELATARVTDTNDDDFARAVLKALPLRKYEPALVNDVPVRQIVQVEQFHAANRMPFTVRRVDGPVMSVPRPPGRPRGC